MESCAAVLRRKMPCRSFGIVWERETKPRQMRAAGMQTADDQKSASAPFPGTEALSLCGTTRVGGKDPARSFRRFALHLQARRFPRNGGKLRRKLLGPSGPFASALPCPFGVPLPAGFQLLRLSVRQLWHAYLHTFRGFFYALYCIPAGIACQASSADWFSGRPPRRARRECGCPFRAVHSSGSNS